MVLMTRQLCFVVCATICTDHMAENKIRKKRLFYRRKIVGETGSCQEMSYELIDRKFEKKKSEQKQYLTLCRQRAPN